MVELTNRRAQANGVADRVQAAKMPFEALGFHDAFFDLAFGNMVLHHVDADAAAGELSRVLKPGGRAVFAETSGLDPILMLARRCLAGRFGIAKNSSLGEKPLGPQELTALGRHFTSLKTHFIEFVFLTMVANNALKWKRSTRLLQRLLVGTDRIIYRCCPFLRKYSYLMVVELTR